MSRAWLTAACMAALLMDLAGCTSEPPPPATHKVEGTVVRKDGKAYTGGGHIEFRLLDSQHGSFGKISPDGDFTLKTIAGTQSVDGAQAGEHMVTIMVEGDGKNPQRIELKTRYTVKAGETNRITVTLEK